MKLVAKHGTDVVRALDKAPDALPLLKLLKITCRRDRQSGIASLAAGSAGNKELATLSTKLGVVALQAGSQTSRRVAFDLLELWEATGRVKP